jgi:formylglycine-generating enzyme required for sulfatase activity
VLAVLVLATIVAGTLLVPAPAGDAVGKLPTIDEKKHKDYTEKLTEKVSFDMIAIPGGVFLMGSPENEEGRSDIEGPQHPVGIKPFWMGKCEVRWEEYDLYWQKKPDPAKLKGPDVHPADAVSRPTPPYSDETFDHGRDGRPCLCITHHAAMEYCRWLSAKTGKTYRLPTEAEWEWACRAGTTTAYSFGNDPEKIGDYAWYQENAPAHPGKVGTKKPNPWGLYDMHGNVAEWCIDYYVKDSNYSKYPKDKVTWQPVSLPVNKRYPYIVRGGAWTQAAEKLRSAYRGLSTKDWLERDPQRPQSVWWMTDADFVGFRVVCPVEEQPNLKGLRSTITRETDDY